MEKKLMSRTQAAIYLGFDRRTLLKWERQGYGPKVVYMPSGRPMYARASLDAFVETLGQHQ